MTLRKYANCFALLALAGCAASPDGHLKARSKSKEAQAHSVHWSYEGATGPEHWGDLSPAYALAKTGKRQSPIDIRGARHADVPPIEFHYQRSPIQLVNNGHTIQQTQADGSWIRLDGARYDLKQFHFHAPSEHTMEGRHFDMEMHLVHESADGDVAVVGVLIEQGKPNVGLHPMWDDLPDEEASVQNSAATVDAASLLPLRRSYYRYSGSLTTPPCTEDVLWLVLSEPIEISHGQINRFRSIMNGNNRPVQPLHGREILAGE